LHSVKAFSVSHAAPPAGTADPNRPKGYPILSDIVLSNESWGKMEEEGTFMVIVFFFPSHSYACWSPAFLEMAEQLPGEGKQ